MPTAKNTVTAYVDDDIKGYLTDYSKQKGISQSKALEEILTIFFKGDIPDNVPSNVPDKVLDERIAEGIENRLGKFQPPVAIVEAILEEKLQSYQANFNEALARVWERLEAVESAPDTAKADADQETRSRLETTPANLDAVLIQKHLSTTAHSDDPTPPQPSPPVMPRKTDTDGGGDEAAPDTIGDNVTLTNSEMADHLGITRQALDERRKNKNYPDGYYPIKQGRQWTWVRE
jgi:hypothetical protein